MHRNHENAFTRTRKLGFATVVTLILQKSLKSIQLLLNEMILKLEKQDTVTHSAFTQARANLNYTAFIELNQRAVVQTTYNTPDYKQFKGLRVLAIDGSLIRLPRTQSTIDVFGSRPYSNGASSSQGGEHTYAMASVLYDALIRNSTISGGVLKRFLVFSKLD